MARGGDGGWFVGAGYESSFHRDLRDLHGLCLWFATDNATEYFGFKFNTAGIGNNQPLADTVWAFKPLVTTDGIRVGGTLGQVMGDFWSPGGRRGWDGRHI